MKYDYEFDPQDDSPAAIITRMVPVGSRVLEIGAGPGSITKELKRRKNCHVTALDIDEQYIERLTEFCDAAYQVDLNNPGWPRVLENEDKFDVVIAADVLEHLRDPWKTLPEILSLIDDDGEILISLPHVGHCGVAACLINSNFDYREEGLLDRTHIRFFGLKNIQDLINGARLNIIDAQFIVRRPESTEFASQWSQLSTEVQQSLLNGKYSCIYQVVVKVTKQIKGSKNIKLEKLNVEEAHVDSFVHLVPSGALRTFLRKQAKSHLSADSRRRLRRLLTRIGGRT